MEESSGNRRGGGGASHGAQSAGVARKYLHLMTRHGRKIAKVAMARRLTVRLYWMMHQGWEYGQWIKFGSHAGQPGHRHGVQKNTEKLIGRPALLHRVRSSNQDRGDGPRCMARTEFLT